MSDPIELADRYVAMWMEPDAARRRAAIRELWAADAVHVLQPPEELNDAATALGFSSTLEARGYEQLDARVTRAHDEFVGRGGFVFRRRDAPARLHDVVKLRWEMLPAGGGEVVGGGLDILVLDGNGRIQCDYQFIEG